MLPLLILPFSRNWQEPFSHRAEGTECTRGALLQGKGIMKIRGLWRGMGVTLAKDVPFAAGYWALMEPLRARLLPDEASVSRSQVNGPTNALSKLIHITIQHHMNTTCVLHNGSSMLQQSSRNI